MADGQSLGAPLRCAANGLPTLGRQWTTQTRGSVAVAGALRVARSIQVGGRTGAKAQTHTARWLMKPNRNRDQQSGCVDWRSHSRAHREPFGSTTSLAPGGANDVVEPKGSAPEDH